MIKKIIKSVFKFFGLEVKRRPAMGGSMPRRYLTRHADRLLYYETPAGNYYLPEGHGNDAIVYAMSRGDVFEPEVVEMAKRHIRSGTAVLDVGANLGQMSVIFSKLAGERGLVYAFEADDFLFEILKKNIDANGCKNAVPVFGAVWSENSRELIFPRPDFIKSHTYGSYGISPDAAFGRKVNSVTIDSLRIETPISFMKIDVQGSDLHAMRGAVQTIKKHQMPILFEFEEEFRGEFKTTFQDYVDFVDSIGYKFEEVILSINYLVVPK